MEFREEEEDGCEDTGESCCSNIVREGLALHNHNDTALAVRVCGGVMQGLCSL